MKLLLIIAFASDAYNLFHLVNAAEPSSSLFHTPDSTNSENTHGIFRNIQDRPEQGLRPLNPRLNPNPEDGFRTPNNRPNLAGVDRDMLFLPSFGSHGETSSMDSSSPEILRGNSWLYPNGQENQILRNLRFESPVGDRNGAIGHVNPNILLPGILDGDGQIRLRPRPQNLGFLGNQNHLRFPIHANADQVLRTPIRTENGNNAEPGLRSPVNQGINDGQAALQDNGINLRPRPQNLDFLGNQNLPRDNRPINAIPEQRHRGFRLNFRSRPQNQHPQRINQPIHVNLEQGLPIRRGNDINAEQGFRTPVNQRVDDINAEQGFRTPVDQRVDDINAEQGFRTPVDQRVDDINAEQGFRTPVDQIVNDGQAALQDSRPNANPEQRHRGLRLNFRSRPQNQRLSENLNQPPQRINQPIHVNPEQDLPIGRGNDINAEQGFRTPPFNNQLSPFEVPVLARRPAQPIQLPNIESQRAQGESVLQPGRRERNPFRGIFGYLGRPSAGRVNQHGNINPEAGNNLPAIRNPSTPRTPRTPILPFRF